LVLLFFLKKANHRGGVALPLAKIFMAGLAIVAVIGSNQKKLLPQSKIRSMLTKARDKGALCAFP
jgi:hypothetical protein